MRQAEEPTSLQGEPEDQNIVDQVLRGDTELFRILIDRHKHAVFNLIARQLGERELAEDLSQETFIKAFRALDTFRGESSFSTWLIRIALNTTNTYLSSKAHTVKRLEVEESSFVQESGSDPHAEQEMQEVILAFRRCFAKLGPRFREIVSLCGFEERSYEEVATILLIPSGTVKSRLNKARLLLKQCLATHLD